MDSVTRFKICPGVSNVSWKNFTPAVFTETHGTLIFIADINDLQSTNFSVFSSALNEVEKKHADTFRHDQSKKQYIVGRYMLRFLLAGFLQQEFREIGFAMTSQKKPYLLNPANRMHFNISHSGNKIVIAINFMEPVGIDIEKTDPAFDYATFAEKHFSPGEQQLLTGDDRRKILDNFYMVWTRKEAWLKLTGEGITDDLAFYDVSNLTATPEIFICSCRLDDYWISIATGKSTELQFFEIKNFIA